MSTVCTIARSKCATMKDFKVNAGVGNKLVLLFQRKTPRRLKACRKLFKSANEIVHLEYSC